LEHFTRKLITEWRRLDLPFQGENNLVAVSGGADSSALAIGLAELRDRKKITNGFVIAHFNHKLRAEESDADEAFVEQLSEKLGFEFVSGEPEECLLETGNLEQNAREARYRFLTKTADELSCFAILTAHTQNDQAETLLLNLIRGSGIEGLAGMKVSRLLRDGEDLNETTQNENMLLVRPLLNWAKREDTEKFVLDRNFDFREDLMNQDKRFNRVRIRRELIPNLKNYNPKIIETLARTADTLRNEAEILKQIDDENTLPIDKLPVKLLKTIGEPRFKRCLRSWLKGKRGDLRRIDRKHIDAIVSLVKSRKSGSVCELPRGERVIKTKGELIFVGAEVEKRF